MYGSVKESQRVRDDLGGLPHKTHNDIGKASHAAGELPITNGYVSHPDVGWEGDENDDIVGEGSQSSPRDIPDLPSRSQLARGKSNRRTRRARDESSLDVTVRGTRGTQRGLQRNGSSSSLGHDHPVSNTWLDRSMSVPAASGDPLRPDEDEDDVITPLTHTAGRRSAPLFSRRSFGTKVFWNDGQTSINRLAKQGEPVRKGFKGNFWNGGRSYKRKDKPQDRSKTYEDVGHRNEKETSRKRQTVKQGPAITSEKSEGQNSEIFENRDPIIAACSPTLVNSSGYFSDFDGNSRCVVTHGFRENLEPDASCRSPRPSTGRTSDGVLEPRDAAAINNLLDDSIGRLRGLGVGGFKTSRNILPTDHARANPDGESFLSPYLPNGGSPSPYIRDGHQYVQENQKGKDPDSSSEDSDESSPLLDDKSGSVGRESKTAVYHRRWYLLFLFSMFAVVWNAVWSTWGPIAQSAKEVYDWTDGNIAMFTWLGNAPFLITMFPIAYLMDVKGMRVSMILCCGFTFVGAGLRCIPANVEISTWLIYAGQLLNGIAGTVPMSGPGLLSGLWFPPNQRATATAISTVAGYLGSCVSFVIGPLLVREPDSDIPDNTTDPTYLLFMDSGNSSNITDVTALKDGIMDILYFECGAAGIIFLLVLLYFPSKPPRPPSVSASIPREKYLDGLKSLVRNKQFWVVAVAYSVPVGVYEVWQVVLDVNLNPRVSQQTAGWMDFFSTLGGCASGLLVSRFADYFTRQMKLCLILFYFLASLAALWMSLVVADYLPFDEVSVYAATVIIGVFLDGGAPLFFELVIEVSYPVGEGVTSGFLQLITASSGMLFLSLLEIESIGKEWMNWCFFGCIATAIPLLFLIDTVYGRADVDDMEVDVSEDEDDVTNILGQEEPDRRSLLNSSHV